MHGHNLLGIVFFVVAGLLVPYCAQAFKINTHVYVGKEVVESLEQCKKERGVSCVYLNLNDGDTLTALVDPVVASAILGNQETYLIGQYGALVIVSAKRRLG